MFKQLAWTADIITLPWQVLLSPHTHITSVLILKKKLSQKKLRAPHLTSLYEFLKWVQMFNIAYSKKHWHTILPEQSPPLYPAGHWQVPLLVSQIPPFWHCGWHTIPVWTTMCGSDDEFKLTTINRLLQCNVHNGVCTSIVHVRSLRPGWLHTRLVQSCRTSYQSNWSRWNRWDIHTFPYQHWKTSLTSQATPYIRHQ